MNSQSESEETAGLKLMLQEFKQNPYQKFNVAFGLMSVIPFMVFLYLLAARLFTVDILIGDIGLVLVVALFISLCGLFIGYGILKNTLSKVMSYAVRARRCSELRSIFVATVTHEFRNPLYQISSGIKNILEGMPDKLTEEVRESLEECQRGADKLWDLATHLLDIYKVEAGMIIIEKKVCDLVGILEKQVRDVENIIEERDIKLSRDIFGEDLFIYADEGKVNLVVDKLLNNAIKITPKDGEIILRVFSSDEFVRMEIQCTGRSIPTEELESMFNKDGVLDCRGEETELGLAIARDLVELHKGRVWGESDPERGVKFILVLRKTERPHKKIQE